MSWAGGKFHIEDQRRVNAGSIGRVQQRTATCNFLSVLPVSVEEEEVVTNWRHVGEVAKRKTPEISHGTTYTCTLLWTPISLSSFLFSLSRPQLAFYSQIFLVILDRPPLVLSPWGNHVSLRWRRISSYMVGSSVYSIAVHGGHAEAVQL